MSRYKMTINTSSYVCAKCSKKDWEPGTMNDYMLAINGLKRTLYSKKEVIWQLELFRGNSFIKSEYADTNSRENYGLSDKYVKFLEKNKITYYDRLCDMSRSQFLSGYGFIMGYFDIDKAMGELSEKGTVKIPFEWLYDGRQCAKSMKGCYMEITKCD